VASDFDVSETLGFKGFSRIIPAVAASKNGACNGDCE